MRMESGRSLIELIGVLAITGVMAASAIGMYRVIRTNQVRHIASATLEQIAKNTKLLLEMRGDYTGVSIDYLIKSGALKSTAAPLGGSDWSVTASSDGKSFAINLTQLSSGDCQYLVSMPASFATSVTVNGYTTDPDTRCYSAAPNQVSFIVE